MGTDMTAEMFEMGASMRHRGGARPDLETIEARVRKANSRTNMVDELDVRIRNKARQFIAGFVQNRYMSVYIQKVEAKLKTEEMDKGESGYTLTKRDGTSTIIVNRLERRERQRFSACHEIGHIVLELRFQSQRNSAMVLR